MSASPGPRPSPESTVVALDADAAGEVLTLRRAAFLAAGADHDDYTIPPLIEPLAAVHAELADPATLALGVREGGRLLASVSLRRVGEDVELSRFAVVPDRQGEGLGGRLLRAAESAFPDARTIRLATGEFSTANLAMYARAGYVETHRISVGRYHLVHLAKPLR